ncbi:MAG: DUF4192 domain-containing protein [Actinobacteria bacterium]|nr:DUF4192 domain-containing protein [Actinomycetota bacterium]
MTVHMTSPGEFLTSLPYQIGFYPHRSLVVVMTRDKTVILVARMDVPEHPVHADRALDAGCADLQRQIGAGNLDGAHLALFDDSLLGLAALVRVGDRLAESGVTLGLAALVSDGMFRLLGAPDGNWETLPRPEDCAIVAELVAQGRSVAPDRDAAIACLAPCRPPTTAGTELTARECSVPVHAIGEWRALLALVPPDEPDPWQPSPATAIRISRSLLDRDFRDAMVAGLVPGTLPDSELVEPAATRAARILAPLHDELDRHRTARRHVEGGEQPPWHGPDLQRARLREVLERILTVARLAPAPIAAGPYAVAAILAGRLGEGLVCTGAIEHALEADPDHVLANIMADMVASGHVPGRPPGTVVQDSGAA